MLRLDTRDPGFAEAFKRLVADRRESGDDLARDVEAILGEVKTRGDAALADMTARWDGHTLASDADWQFSGEQCREAFDALKPDLRAALESGNTTSVELVKAYLARIDAYGCFLTEVFLKVKARGDVEEFARFRHEGLAAHPRMEGRLVARRAQPSRQCAQRV